MSKLCEIEVIKHCNIISIDLHLPGLIAACVSAVLSPSWLQTHIKLFRNAVFACSFCPCIVILPYDESVACLLMLINVLRQTILVWVTHLQWSGLIVAVTLHEHGKQTIRKTSLIKKDQFTGGSEKGGFSPFVYTWWATDNQAWLDLVFGWSHVLCSSPDLCRSCRFEQ